MNIEWFGLNWFVFECLKQGWFLGCEQHQTQKRPYPHIWNTLFPESLPVAETQNSHRIFWMDAWKWSMIFLFRIGRRHCATGHPCPARIRVFFWNYNDAWISCHCLLPLSDRVLKNCCACWCCVKILLNAHLRYVNSAFSHHFALPQLRSWRF